MLITVPVRRFAARHPGTIHEILTRRVYTGVRDFNEFARKSDGERKAQSEIVEYEIPAIRDLVS